MWMAGFWRGHSAVKGALRASRAAFGNASLDRAFPARATYTATQMESSACLTKYSETVPFE
jgi:hypothetical protein